MADKYQKDIAEDTFSRGLRASLEVAQMTGKKLIEEHRIRVAGTLLSAGIHLIRSEHLQDHQFVVSPGVYAAAVKLCEKDT
jgi:hypothetical protein